MVPSDFSLRFPFPREVRFNRRGPFFEFFSLLFFARKIDASKTHFSSHFWRFSAIFPPKMGDLGSILGAWGRLFVMILLIESKLHFFMFFFVFFARLTESAPQARLKLSSKRQRPRGGVWGGDRCRKPKLGHADDGKRACRDWS